MRLPVISKALQRYRVSRGYGVHSPFAYRFIIRVLRETLPYYGFDRLNSLRGDMSAADARLLFRITDFFRPAKVCVTGTHAAQARSIILAAAPRTRFTDTPEDADMTVAAAPLSAEGLADVRCPVIMTTRCPEPLWQHAIDTSARAMTFTNGRTGVIVNRSGLPRHDYRLRF